MEPKPPPTTPLQKSLNILHLLHHRNKNQHRRAHWWKYLDLLKRNLQKLITELDNSDTLRSVARAQYLREHLLERCYVAFTEVVQDSQFSTLGLVLVAELARVRKCIGGHCGRRVDDSGRKIEAVGGELSLEGAAHGLFGNGMGKDEVVDDVGEVVERMPDAEVDMLDANAVKVEEKPVETRLSTQPELATESPARDIKRQKTKSTKAKKGKSVIDDLFRGLG